MANNSLLENVFVNELSFNFDLDFKNRETSVFIYNNVLKHPEVQAFKAMDTSNYSIVKWSSFKNKIIELSKKMGGDSNKLKKCFEFIPESEYDLPIGAYLIKTKTQKLWIILGRFRYFDEDKFVRQKIWVFDAETQKLIDLIREGP